MGEPRYEDETNERLSELLNGRAPELNINVGDHNRETVIALLKFLDSFEMKKGHDR